jgi:hypothetical protein
MDALLDIASFPFLALFLAALLFLHIGLRGKASLLSLLSITMLMVWMSSAHTVFHWFSDSEHPVAALRMEDYSPHPVFDIVASAIAFALISLFFVSFFFAAISVSATNTPRPLPGFLGRVVNGMSTKVLWLLTAAAATLSLASAICYRHIAATGYHEAFAVPLAVVALSNLACVVLLIGIAIRRRFIQSRSD